MLRFANMLCRRGIELEKVMSCFHVRVGGGEGGRLWRLGRTADFRAPWLALEPPHNQCSVLVLLFSFYQPLLRTDHQHADTAAERLREGDDWAAGGESKDARRRR